MPAQPYFVLDAAQYSAADASTKQLYASEPDEEGFYVANWFLATLR